MTSRASRDHPPSSTSSGDVRLQSTACRGAFHAFSSATPTNLLPKAHDGAKGALAAATSAGTERRRKGVRPAEGATSDGQKEEESATPRWSGSLEKAEYLRERSPSYAAAMHATSKFTPASTHKPFKSTSNSLRQSRLQTSMNNGVHRPGIVPRSTDEAVVGATNSLIRLFESKQKSQNNIPVTHSIRYITPPISALASPTSIDSSVTPSLPASRALNTSPLTSEGVVAKGSSNVIDSGATIAVWPSVGRSGTATTRPRNPTQMTVLPVPERPAQPQSGAHAPLVASQDRCRNTSGNPMRSHSPAFAQARPAEPSTFQPPSPSDPVSLPLELHPDTRAQPLLSIRSTKSFETKVDSMANTIVAASLAASRAPSPTKPPPPPPRRHKSHSLFPNHNSQRHLSRTPSPAKPMKQTMRETLPSDDEMNSKKKSISMRKHPHKHHEGDRKKYRAIVTERERRRYDGVWAANRGLWMNADSSDSVVNFVVRDIWSRSRLPNDVLADIWDLVDIDGSDRLKRNEFVVGLWLIDQRLKGRKLPTLVSESLWNSVRLLHGVKVSRLQH